MDEPAFKEFDNKLLTSYVLEGLVTDLRTDENKGDMIDSIKYLTTLEGTTTYFTAAMDKLYFEQPYISENSVKLYGQESIYNFMQVLEVDQAAAPIFLEFILDKNG